MKKLWRTFFAAGVMSLAFCLFAGMTVFAETDGGELCEGFTWSFDSDTGTLTVTGEGQCLFLPTWPEFEEGDFWAPYEKQIQKVYLDGISYFLVDYCLDHVNNFSGHVNHQVFWQYDKLAKSLTISGNGEFSNQPMIGYSESIQIGDGITAVNFQVNMEAKRVDIGRDCQFSNWMRWTTDTFEVDPQNPYMAAYNGCLYTKDFTKLLCCPRSQSAPAFHPNLKIIGTQSFIFNEIPTLVVPWGVTTIEHAAFSIDSGKPGQIPEIILPDTVTSMKHGIGKDQQLLFIYSQNNQAVHQQLDGKADSFYQPYFRQVDTVAHYYPDVPEAQGPGPASSPTESKPESSTPASQPESKPESKPESSAPASSTPASQPASKPTENAASSQPAESKPAPESSAPAQSSAPSSEPESSVAPVEEPSTEESSIAEPSQEESAAESSGESSESAESSEPEGLPTVEKKVGGTMLVVLAVVLAAAGGAGIAVLALKKRKK